MAPQALPPELRRIPFRATQDPDDRAWLEARLGPGKRWLTSSDYLDEATKIMRRFEKAVESYTAQYIDAEARRAAANR